MMQGNGSGAAQPRTTLQFYGQAQGVKVNVPKGNGYYSTDSGSIDITFRVTAPSKPRDPRRNRNVWQIEQAQKIIDGFGGVKPDPKPVGTLVDNAFTDFAKMIVVESGSTKVGAWVEEERNVYEDYRLAFGEDPPAINGIAIMTDTDNTQERAVAYYGDIVFLQAAKPAP